MKATLKRKRRRMTVALTGKGTFAVPSESYPICDLVGVAPDCGDVNEDGFSSGDCSCGGSDKGGCSCGGHGEGGCSCGGSCSCGKHVAVPDEKPIDAPTERKHIAVAIDGPAGAGKTTTARLLAKKLGYIYVDTGALYRAFAYHKLWLQKEHGEEVSNESALHTFNLDYRQEDGIQRMFVWGKDVTDELRTPEVSTEASTTSADPAVRAALLEFQRRQAMAYDVVMEGRDIGTVVIPDAEVKFFLVADLSERCSRCYRDQKAAGREVDYNDLLEQMRTRDWQDSTRRVAPLKPAPDAIEVDNTAITLEETVEKLHGVVLARLKAKVLG